jgi:VanZ family protein
MQDVFLFPDKDGVTGIIAAGVTDDKVRLLCQHINDFAFAFVAPLGAYQYCIGHRITEIPRTQTRGQGALPLRAETKKPLCRCQRWIGIAGARGSLVLCAVLKLRSFVTYWLPVLLWMCVIFSASSDRMSMEHSSRIVGPIVRWLFPHVAEHTVRGTVVFARKCAHLTEYGILALLIWRAFRKPARNALRPWQWPVAARVALLVLLYAATDEFHQCFVPSRNGSLLDVLLDTSGAILVLLFLWGLGRWRRRW